MRQADLDRDDVRRPMNASKIYSIYQPHDEMSSMTPSSSQPANSQFLNGAGASLMLSHDRQETFSRTC